MTNYIAYYRVSTTQQGVSGLGLEAQQQAVNNFTRNAPITAHYTDIESGKNNNRPQLLKALQHAKESDSTLLIAKLDRLSRNLAFIVALMDSKVKFTCCDMPEANELTIHIMAVIAQNEAKMISARTKAALQAKKERGYKLGNPQNLTDDARAKGRQVIIDKAEQNNNNRLSRAFAGNLRASGKTLAQIATELNDAGFKSSKGGKLNAEQVRRLLM